jgi:hypothetical protein
MPSFSSIILRFRDLSTPAGTTTINEHKKILDPKTYVWWGWWHKQGEIVPENAFRKILTAIEKSSDYEIFLFDTGKYKLYRARLADIKWDNRLISIATPERDSTPRYYGDSHYLAWFKLSYIEDKPFPETELKNWSYVQVDEFFDTKKSVFEAFYNKQLSSFTELRNQDRTIWFIRQFQKKLDKVHEIHVYDRSKTAPSNFPEEIIQLHTPNLLWISDPHFSKDHHDFSRRRGVTRSNLGEIIRRDLEQIGTDRVGGLLISGDVTWRAAREEFELAREFIEYIKSWSKITASHILVCPGNHDLAFSREPWAKGTPATETGEASGAEYRFFL